jgi:hypothetical protein
MGIHVSHSLKIIGLAAVTVGLALAIGLGLPKISHAPIQDPINMAQLSEPSSVSPLPVISFDTLTDNARVKPNQVITGKVPGYWFFEASFPVQLRDISGNTFATVIAQTTEDWMVTTNVAFTITLPETFSYSGVGSILFKRDDPSDGEAPKKPEDEEIVPVIFENE